MSKKFLKDLAERAAATYVESFVGLLLVSWGTDINLDVFTSAAIAAVPAALAVLKSGLATLKGDSDSAGLVD